MQIDMKIINDAHNLRREDNDIYFADIVSDYRTMIFVF